MYLNFEKYSMKTFIFNEIYENDINHAFLLSLRSVSIYITTVLYSRVDLRFDEINFMKCTEQTHEVLK